MAEKELWGVAKELIVQILNEAAIKAMGIKSS